MHGRVCVWHGGMRGGGGRAWQERRLLQRTVRILLERIFIPVSSRNPNTSQLQDGLRDGINEGQEMMLQAGFNVGFQHAADFSQQMAKLRGFLRYESET